MANPAPPPKIKTADSGFQAVIDAVEGAGGEVTAKAAQIVVGPWRSFATAVGQSGPANINRATHAIRAIRGTGR